MNRYLSVLTIVACWGLASAMVFAKRSPPDEVTAVQQDGMEYRVRHQTKTDMQPGFVEAWNLARNGRVWSRQIYVIRCDPLLEGDIQDVFITHINLDANRNVLRIKNERNGEFELDLKTLVVTTVHDEAVIEN